MAKHSLAAGLVLALLAGVPAALAQSEPLFTPIETVMRSPRCMNCHTQTDFPRQGDDRHRHFPAVARGADNHGLAGMRCTTCHGTANRDQAGVPGAPNWGVAPRSMAWEGLQGAQLCRALIDRAKNGGRDGETLFHHMTEDPLVQWAWAPGQRSDGTARAAPSVDRAAFAAALRRWADAGTPCPN